MTTTLRVLLLTSVTAASGWEVSAQEPEALERAGRKNYCVKCHGERKLWEGETLRLFVTEDDLADDIHWQKDLRCHDCHGGDPTTAEFARAHAITAGYRPIKSPTDIPEFCGGCHSNIEYMRRYRSSLRTDQLAQYWTSGHGQRLKKDGDPKVATCVSCHRHHGIRPVDDLDSPVYPTRLAKTCAVCHSDPKVSAGRKFRGRPLGHDQLQLWMSSVHAEALLKTGNLSAPTCNDCHGSHSVLPPEVDSVASACGRCHTKIFRLFSQTRMKHQFEEVGLPGCATCHGYHDIRSPSDEMLGMGDEGVCTHCHAEGRLGAPLAGAQVISAMRSRLEQLKDRIARAELKLSRAELLGMDVRGPRFDLQKAFNKLTNARSSIHSFALDPVVGSLNEGLHVADQVIQGAEDALRGNTVRRIWLGVSVIPILVVIFLLLLCIRTLPSPTGPDHPTPEL